MRRIVVCTVALLICTACLAQTAGHPVQYTRDDQMILPKDYRQWVFLSSGINMTYGPNAGTAANPHFENVFVNPAAYQVFLKSGTWPDKTALIIEIRDSDSKVSINKDGRVQTNFSFAEAHVKDSSRGGWAFYAFHDGAQQATLIPKSAACYSCHEQNGGADTTFVQFYPTLIEIAKNKGTYKEVPGE
jgi:hypothetical protein